MRKPSTRSIHRQTAQGTNKADRLPSEADRLLLAVNAIRNSNSPKSAGELLLFCERQIYEAALAQVSEPERQRFLKLLSLDV